MAFEIRVVSGVLSGGSTISKTNKYSGSLQTRLNEVIAAAQTNYEIDIALDVSALQAIFIVSSQDVTLKTNNAGSPADTLDLTANKPYQWDIDSYHDCLLTTDVTKFFVTNSGSNSAILQLEAVLDATT